MFNHLPVSLYVLMMTTPVERPPENLEMNTADVAEKMQTTQKWHTCVQKQTGMAFGRAKRRYDERV